MIIDHPIHQGADDIITPQAPSNAYTPPPHPTPLTFTNTRPVTYAHTLAPMNTSSKRATQLERLKPNICNCIVLYCLCIMNTFLKETQDAHSEYLKLNICTKGHLHTAE